jgi:very-short-patch-repair endonuclease
MTEWTPEYWSWLERKFGILLGEMKVKGVKHNWEAEGMDGRRYYIDFAIPGIRLAIECDSEMYHSKSYQKRNDRVRQRTLEEAGWTFIRFTSDDILRDHDGVKRKLLKAMNDAQKHRQAQLDVLSKSVKLR